MMVSWLSLVVAVGIGITGVAVWLVRRGKIGARATDGVQAAYVVGAAISLMTLGSIVVKVAEHVPGRVTVVDVGVLAFTGIIAGVFLALSVARFQSS